MHYFLGDELTLDPRYGVVITGHNGNGKSAFTVNGTMQSDFNITGGNSYDEQGAAISEAVNSTRIGATINSFKQAGETFTSAGTGANRLLTQIGSQLTWQGSKSPSFSIDLTFVCLDSANPKEDVVDKVNFLMKAVYPEINGFLFTPPMGYRTNVKGGKTLAGKSSLSIGKWFHADYLVIEDVQFSYSKEMNRIGRPLYATGNITLRPFHTVTYKEFLGWYR